MGQQFLLMLALHLACRFLGICKGLDGCPDGVCDEAIADAKTLSATLARDDVKVGAPGLFRWIGFLRCFDFDRVFALYGRVQDLIKDIRTCPEGDDTAGFFACLDVAEAVEIAKEFIDIIRDARICNDGISVGAVA